MPGVPLFRGPIKCGFRNVECGIKDRKDGMRSGVGYAVAGGIELLVLKAVGQICRTEIQLSWIGVFGIFAFRSAFRILHSTCDWGFYGEYDEL